MNTTPQTRPRTDTMRREDDALLRGQACFGQDLPLPGAWHLVFVRSPQAHARLRPLDTRAAQAMPGVRAVLTARELGTHQLPDINPLLPLLQPCPFPLLAGDEVHYAGQPIALVVADTRAQALAAAAQLECRLDPLPVATDWDRDNEVVVRTEHRAGDMPTTTAQATCQLQVPRLNPMPLEPRACSARWCADSQMLTVWLGTQTPSRAQADVARALGLPLAQVHLISPDVGGAFGARASVSPEELLVPLATQHLSRDHGSVSLRWTSTRSEDFAAGMHGRGGQLQAQLWAAADGRLQALSARLHFSLGAWLPFSAVVPLRNAARILPGPYDLRTLDIQGVGSRAHAAPVNIYRGAGRPEATLLMETLIERAARRLKLDPIVMRRRNLIAASAMPYTTANGEVLDSGDYAALLEQACARFDYAAERAAQVRRRNEGEWVGIGTALYVEPCGQGWESARITWHANGRVVLASGSPAQGQGHATTYAQLAAEQLGCDAAQVEVVMGDSAQCPPGIGALASRSTAIAGSAIVKACQTVMALREQGAPAPWVAEETFTSQEAWSSGCVMVRLSVNAETGQPTLERVVWIDDAGRVLQPNLVHGQLIGGAAQGIGQALLEQLVYDHQGQLLTGSLMDYAVPRADHMPEIEIESLHTPSPLNLLGAKGVGEAGCIGVPAAILNAAIDALSPLGEVDLQFPLTSEQLWRALSSSHPESTERSYA
jgi:carbon-monoxide dehydrogenase large subunit